LRERDNVPALSELAPFGAETRMKEKKTAPMGDQSFVIRARKGASFSLRSKGK